MGLRSVSALGVLCLVALFGCAAAQPIGAGTYGYLTDTTNQLVLFSAGPSVYVSFEGRPMSMFFGTEIRTTASGSNVTQLRFLVRRTSSNRQEYALLTCDVGQFGTGSNAPCSTDNPSDTLKHGMGMGSNGALGSIATIVLDFATKPIIQLADSSWGPGEAGFYSADQSTLTVPSTYVALSALNKAFTRYAVLPPPSPPPSPSPPPFPPPQSQSFYRYEAVAKNFSAAQADCQSSSSWRGHLVSIADQAENDKIYNDHCSTVDCWIGLHKVLDGNGVLVWSWYNKGVGGGAQTLYDFDNFDPFDPEPNSGGCAVMKSGTVLAGKWQEMGSCATKRAYVCEYKEFMPPSPPPPPSPPSSAASRAGAAGVGTRLDGGTPALTLPSTPPPPPLLLLLAIAYRDASRLPVSPEVNLSPATPLLPPTPPPLLSPGAFAVASPSLLLKVESSLGACVGTRSEGGRPAFSPPDFDFLIPRAKPLDIFTRSAAGSEGSTASSSTTYSARGISSPFASLSVSKVKMMSPPPSLAAAPSERAAASSGSIALVSVLPLWAGSLSLPCPAALGAVLSGVAVPTRSDEEPTIPPPPPELYRFLLVPFGRFLGSDGGALAPPPRASLPPPPSSMELPPSGSEPLPSASSLTSPTSHVSPCSPSIPSPAAVPSESFARGEGEQRGGGNTARRGDRRAAAPCVRTPLRVVSEPTFPAARSASSPLAKAATPLAEAEEENKGKEGGGANDEDEGKEHAEDAVEGSAWEEEEERGEDACRMVVDEEEKSRGRLI